MKVGILIAIVICTSLVHSYPLDDSSLLDLGDDKTAPQSPSAAAAVKDNVPLDGYDEKDRSWESMLRRLHQETGASVDPLNQRGRLYSAGGRQKKQLGLSSGGGWNSGLDAPDPFFSPIHLQNWGSQFGRNYRTFDGGHQSPGRLRPAPLGGLHMGGGGSAGLFGQDDLQDWRALYHDGRK